MKQAILLVALVASAAACSSSSGQGTDGGTSLGGAVLTIQSVTSPGTIASTKPSQGTAFEVITLTLANSSSQVPLATMAAMFTLDTDQHLVLMTPALEGGLATPCTGTASVAVGGSLSCEVVYEVPTGQKALTLVYDDLMGHRATVAVPAETPGDACVTVSGYAKLASPACQTCLPSSCASEGQAQNSACGTTCSQCTTMSDPTAKCACEQQCASSACWTAYEALFQCVADHCADSCM